MFEAHIFASLSAQYRADIDLVMLRLVPGGPHQPELSAVWDLPPGHRSGGKQTARTDIARRRAVEVFVVAASCSARERKTEQER